MTILSSHHLTRSFGGLIAVDDVDLGVDEGEILGLIGPNGAGKTTWVNVVTGVLAPSAGRVTYRGEDITEWPIHRRAEAGLVRTFQGVRLLPEQTLLANVEIGAYTSGRTGVTAAALGLPAVHRDLETMHERAMEVLDFVGLIDRSDVLAGELSTGEQRLAGVARALAARPTVLLLDEPAAGLNETETAQLTGALAELPGRGVTVIVVEHHMQLIMSISHRVAVFDDGALIALGEPAAVRRDERVVTAYLGGVA